MLFHVIDLHPPQCFVRLGGHRLQDRLSSGSADIKLPAEFQCVLQGVGFMGILCNTGWERKMPGFDCIIAMADANVHGFAHPFLLVVENLRFLLS